MTSRAPSWLDRYARHLSFWAKHHPDPKKRQRCRNLLNQINQKNGDNR